MTKPEIYIGIDPGTHTGVAVWNSREREFEYVLTMDEFEAKVFVMNILQAYEHVHVVVEDARKRKKFQGGPERLQGAGSVKRDSKQWEDTLKNFQKTYTGLTFKMVAPNGKTNKLAENKELTHKNLNIRGVTSIHARCAAFLVWNA